MDLGVRSNYDAPHTAAIKSMVLPSARIVFDENLWRLSHVTGKLPNGTTLTHPVPVIDGTAVVLSKCESVSNPKRNRDAFDIYYVLTGQDGSRVAARLKELSRFPQVEKQIEKLRAFLQQPGNDFSNRVMQQPGALNLEDPARAVRSLLPARRSILSRIFNRKNA